MKNKTLNNWFFLPELGFWTWPMWGHRHEMENYDDVKDIKAISFAINNWMIHLDTAELYATGKAEKILAKAIKPYDRKNLIIASKVKGSNCSYNAIKIACKKSLERLELDYLDLYYIHWRDKQFDLKDCMKAMDELIEEWLIKNIWVSNFSTESLIEAQSYTKNKIVANQVHYNLIYREPEQNLLEYCQKNDVLLVAWRPLELWKLCNAGTALLVDNSVKYKKTHAQISINYLTSQENVVTLFKSSNLEHIEENLGWVWWNLNKEDIKDLKDNFSAKVEKSDTIPLS
jgi:diketogulonate reductase-like aldo/keto reductase